MITLRSPFSGHDIRTQGHGPCAFLALVGAFYTAHSDTDKDQYKFFYQKQLSKKTGHQDCGWAWVEEDRFLKKSLKRCCEKCVIPAIKSVQMPESALFWN